MDADRDLHAVAHLKLVEEVADVGLDRRDAQIESGGDLRVGQSAADRERDLVLAFGQPAEPVLRGRVPARRRLAGDGRDELVRDRRRKRRPAGAGEPDRGDEFGGWGVRGSDPGSSAGRGPG